MVGILQSVFRSQSQVADPASQVWDLPDVAGPRSKGVEFHGRHAGKEHRERAERECRRPRNPLGLQLCNKGLLALHGCLQLLPGGGGDVAHCSLCLGKEDNIRYPVSEGFSYLNCIV